MRAEQLTEPCTSHGEGPSWDAPRDRLLLVDMLAGDVLAVRPDDVGGASVERHHLASVAAALRARRSGGFVLATEDRFLLLDDDLAVERELPPVFADPTLRFNDGGCDPLGAFLVGTMAYDETPGRGTLYRLDPDGRVSVVRTGATISNGVQWTCDGRSALYVDTPTAKVQRFAVDPATGAWSDGRTFAEVDGPGLPDGMAIDEGDGVWVALWGGGQVRRWTADGRLDRVVELPVTQVTACTFGGPDLSTLFITTSRQGVPDGEQPEAGAVFTHDAGIRGAVPHAYAG
ncbi:SMP-30/gluconolactonase/LRE family protein [Microlunatus flavus]|uniref:Sugar lactone lactonase YvrE n=1 Tax=Microlunatus flavus TaxID=1036181 RepID=A0A1H8Z055_9ACTN|nr:SMP-30/gluconolactonase/LRE family protein [Microlunatus flavus]SEP57899.1 Sugar lactone lactonase YvrE [Microlunatus flavus]